MVGSPLTYGQSPNQGKDDQQKPHFRWPDCKVVYEGVQRVALQTENGTCGSMAEGAPSVYKGFG